MAGGPVIRPDQVLERFSRAATTYAGEAFLQRAMAWRLAQLSRRCSIRRGLWADLGSGTGHLAAALEVAHPGQLVIRRWLEVFRNGSTPPGQRIKPARPCPCRCGSN